MKYLVAILGIITISLLVGFLFLAAGIIGSIALSTWETDEMVRTFTYIGVGLGGVLGIIEAIKYLRSHK